MAVLPGVLRHRCTLVGCAAQVTDPGSIEQLYLLGFGKGV